MAMARVKWSRFVKVTSTISKVNISQPLAANASGTQCPRSKMVLYFGSLVQHRFQCLASQWAIFKLKGQVACKKPDLVNDYQPWPKRQQAIEQKTSPVNSKTWSLGTKGIPQNPQ